MRSLGFIAAQLAVIVFPAITCFDIASRLEHWPFSNYPMYSLLYSTPLVSLRLYGMTAKGEIEMRDDDQFPPFDQARLIEALNRLCASDKRDRALPIALRNLLLLYRERHPEGRQLQGLRLYQVSWNLRPGLNGSDPPDARALIAGTPD